MLTHTIRVDFNVWKELQARRETAATTENDVLRGLLKLSTPNSSTVDNGIDQPPPLSDSRRKLVVSFPDDGEVIRDNQVARTFVRAIEKIGPDRVFGLHIGMAGMDLVAKRPGSRRVQWKQLSNGLCQHGVEHGHQTRAIGTHPSRIGGEFSQLV